MMLRDTVKIMQYEKMKQFFLQIIVLFLKTTFQIAGSVGIACLIVSRMGDDAKADLEYVG